MRKRKNGCAAGVLSLILIALIAAFAAYSFTGAEQNIATTANNAAKTKDALILVNKNNKLPDDFKANLTAVDGVKIDKALLNDLTEMRKAAERDNIYLYIAAAYRTKAQQEQIFNDAVSKYVKQGNSRNVAVNRANQTAALPGYSEHETGLAIDFSLNDTERQSEMWDWLSKNAYKYGFILRYPQGREHITGYDYEPWHYRYVGKNHAKVIYEQALVLEEYLNSDFLLHMP